MNPFVPGRGHLPPYLAGRASEQSALRDLLAPLRAGRGSPRDGILSGPRGNGKTALLRWFQQEIAAAEGLDTVWLTPTEVQGLDDLATVLVPPHRFNALRPDKLSFSIGIGRFGWELGDRPASLTRLLLERCKARPLVLLLDEAHTLSLDLGQALLNASQSVSAQAPFLLVMAGTPGLQAHLNAMSATFWSRGKRIGIGLLSESASASALARPLAEQSSSISFEDDALRRAVVESQCYPYFLQLFGAALWASAQASGTARIDISVVGHAEKQFSVERSACYEDRRDELKRSGLLDPAVRLARTFRDQTQVREHDLDAAIAAAPVADRTAEEVNQCRESLADLGFVWKAPGDEDRWQPGIPSLMTYVLDTSATTNPD